MRIGQLARKLDITPTQIIKYLEELGVDVDKGVNTKLMQAGIETIMDEFGTIEMEDEVKLPRPEVISDPDAETEPIEQDSTLESISEEPITVSEEPDVIVEKVDEVQPKEEIEVTEEDPIDVIRPEYVKLQGLKVVDKIDLPTPKPKKIAEPESKPAISAKIENVVKEDAEESHIITEAQIKADLRRHYAEERKKTKTPKPPHKPRKKRTPLTYEQKLVREQKSAEKKKTVREMELKELKRKKYKERMGNNQSQQVSKPMPKKKEVINFQVKEKYQHEPTSLWGKLMKWLNT